MAKLAQLEPVPLRDQWPQEDTHFTPWLASEEGLRLLGDALGMDLQVEGTEVSVGSYRADIVAVDAGSNEKVVIENQLEATNHDHIGKLITYAAAVEAHTIVWVAQEIRQEHRRALEWLNDNTSSDLAFYAIEVELWKIGDSLSAPRLSVVARPSSEVRAVRSVGTADTEGGRTYVDFWTGFNEHLERTSSKIRRRKPQPQHWYDVSIGKTGVYLSVTASLRNENIGCQLTINMAGAKHLMAKLLTEKDTIEREIGKPLDWHDPPGKKASSVRLRSALDVYEKDNWRKAYEWYSQQVALFEKTFAPRVMSFRAEPDPNEADE
jgi:hypothetical protein